MKEVKKIEEERKRRKGKQTKKIDREKRGRKRKKLVGSEKALANQTAVGRELSRGRHDIDDVFGLVFLLTCLAWVGASFVVRANYVAL